MFSFSPDPSQPTTPLNPDTTGMNFDTASQSLRRALFNSPSPTTTPPRHTTNSSSDETPERAKRIALEVIKVCENAFNQQTKGILACRKTARMLWESSPKKSKPKSPEDEEKRRVKKSETSEKALSMLARMAQDASLPNPLEVFLEIEGTLPDSTKLAPDIASLFSACAGRPIDLSVDLLVMKANEPDPADGSRQRSRIGRAYQKHAENRGCNAFQDLLSPETKASRGQPAEFWNQLGMELIERILKNPMAIGKKHKNGVAIWESNYSDSVGAHFTPQGELIGLLSPNERVNGFRELPFYNSPSIT